VALAVFLVVVGFAGTLFFLAPAVEIGNAGLYGGNPWLIGTGVFFFLVFCFGMYRFRTLLRRARQARDRGR
jgi:hypothetical protein